MKFGGKMKEKCCGIPHYSTPNSYPTLQKRHPFEWIWRFFFTLHYFK